MTPVTLFNKNNCRKAQKYIAFVVRTQHNCRCRAIVNPVPRGMAQLEESHSNFQ